MGPRTRAPVPHPPERRRSEPHPRRPWLDGEATLYRFADDLVILCARERDTQRLMTVLPKRFAKYGLTLHPAKTRVIRFTRPPYTPQGQRAQATGRSGTFDLLGFTHYWGRSRQGNWVVKRTAIPGEGVCY